MNTQQQARDERVRELEEQMRVGQARINDIIGVLTRMQADIARLDAAS